MADYLFQGLELLFKENIDADIPCTLNECLGLKVNDFEAFSRSYAGTTFPVTDDNGFFESYFTKDDNNWNFVLANLDLVKCASETINRDTAMLSCNQTKLLEMSCQAIVRLGVEPFIMRECIPKISSQMGEELLKTPKSLEEWNLRDHRLLIVIQALHYVLDTADRRIVAPGPWHIEDTTLRYRDPSSKGRRPIGLAERDLHEEKRRNSQEEPTFSAAEFGLRSSAGGRAPVDAIPTASSDAQVDKRCIDSALQKFADIVMDECFLSVFVGFSHLKRSNRMIDQDPELKVEMLARTKWCHDNLSKFCSMRYLGLIFIDLVMLQAYIENKKTSEPSKFTKRKWLRISTIEILSERLLSTPKGLTVAIRSLLSTESLTNFDEEEKCEQVSIIIMTIIRSYLRTDLLDELFNQLSTLLHCGASFLRQTSASIIIRLLEFDDTLSVLLKNLIFRDSLSRLNHCREIPYGSEYNITYELETLYHIFCKRGQVIYQQPMIVEMIGPMVDILFHFCTHLRISQWRKQIISLICRYLSTMSGADGMRKILSMSCISFTENKDKLYAHQIYRIVVKEVPSTRKVFLDQIHGHDILASMKPEMLYVEDNNNMPPTNAVSTITRTVLDILAELKDKELNADFFIFLLKNQMYTKFVIRIEWSNRQGKKSPLPQASQLLDCILVEADNNNDLIVQFIGQPKRIAIIGKETLQRGDKMLKSNIVLHSQASKDKAKENENSLVIAITLLSCVLTNNLVANDKEIDTILVECVPYLSTIVLIHPEQYTKEMATNLCQSIGTINKRKAEEISLKLTKDTKKKDKERKNITIISDTPSLTLKSHKTIIVDNRQVPDPNNMETYGEALTLVSNPSVPIKGHGIMALIKLLGYREGETMDHIEDVLDIFKDCLTHYDSFIHLQAINGIRAMACFIPDRMLLIILDELESTSKSIDGKIMCRWAEVLMCVCKDIGILKYKNKVLTTLLCVIRHNNNELVKCSSISVLTDIIKELKYNIYGFEEEILMMIEGSLQMSEGTLVRRSSSHFLSFLLRNIDHEHFFEIMQNVIRRVYNLLRVVIGEIGLDPVVSRHVEFAIDEINRHSRFAFQPDIKLEKHIRILRI